MNSICTNIKQSVVLLLSVHDNIEYVYVGSDAPLWMCKFAMLPRHDCDYCQCQACHNAAKGDSRPKRKKIKKETKTGKIRTNSTTQHLPSWMDPKRRSV